LPSTERAETPALLKTGVMDGPLQLVVVVVVAGIKEIVVARRRCNDAMLILLALTSAQTLQAPKNHRLVDREHFFVLTQA
jgi:hypothetical protein